MGIVVGSARHDENGKYVGGTAGDQLQTSNTNDTKGEVSMQDMYKHSKGWYIYRPVSKTTADAIAKTMKAFCNDAHYGYNQNDRLSIITTKAGTNCNCDCSSLVRKVIIDATGKDPGNFTTANEGTKLAATGLFKSKVKYVSQSETPVYNGDVLVTCTKGHTVVVVSGNARKSSDSVENVVATDSAKSFNSKLAGTYKTTGNLNLRNGAGTGKKSLVVLAKGTKVQMYGYYTAVGAVKWYYVTVTYNGVKYTGFCSFQYLTKC